MRHFFLLSVTVLSIFLASCGTSDLTATPTDLPTATVSISLTPDLCSAEILPDEIAKVHKLMREFDDYSVLASNTPQSQLVVIIPELQRILREAEDQKVPDCLFNLKRLQVAHMSAVVQTLMAFMGRTDPNAIGQGIASARELHTQYDLEIARLLGVTVEPPAAPTTTP